MSAVEIVLADVYRQLLRYLHAIRWAAKRASATVPIVMAPVADPLRAGIVANLARPGGNVTGTMLYGSELAGKRVDVFKQAVPGIGRIAVLAAGASPVTKCS